MTEKNAEKRKQKRFDKFHKNNTNGRCSKCGRPLVRSNHHFQCNICYRPSWSRNYKIGGVVLYKK